MSTDIKRRKSQISQTIQSSGYFDSWLDSLVEKELKNIAFLLARDNIPRLVRNLTSNAINNFE